MLTFHNPDFSIIHQIDGRVKIILAVVSILVVNLLPDQAWGVYILLFSLLISVAMMSQVSLGFVVKRSLLALPFVFAAIPIIFIGNDSPAAGSIGIWLNAHYNPEGLVRFTGITIKALISILVAVLLAATTPYNKIVLALQQLHFPALLVAIMALMWRYLIVMIDEVSRMMRARRSRSALKMGRNAPGGSFFWRAHVTGGMAGNLFLRALERSDRVYAAMLARGFSGHFSNQQGTPLDRRSKMILSAGSILLFIFLMLGFWIIV